MRISARNNLKGRVVSVEHGSVNSIVTIEVADGVQLVSMITRDSASDLELEVGREVYAVIKASNVMVAVD
jgi:molybdopterin-binding protein